MLRVTCDQQKLAIMSSEIDLVLTRVRDVMLLCWMLRVWVVRRRKKQEESGKCS